LATVAAYEVGYGKPPIEGRFKPGVSGNPKGRPKRQPSAVADHIDDVLSRPMTFREKGRQRVGTRAEVVVKVVIDRALAGDLAAAQDLLRLILQAERNRFAANTRIEITDWLVDHSGQTAEQKTQSVALRRQTIDAAPDALTMPADDPSHDEGDDR
jgi:hypothetical protein